MYKLIKGNQTAFEELLNREAVEDIIQFCCNNDASYFAALIKLDERAIEDAAKKAEALIKADEAAKAKEAKAKEAARKAALKKELAELEKAEKAKEAATE